MNNQILKYSHTIGLCVMQGRGFMFPVDTLIGKNGRIHTISRAYFTAAFNLRVTVYDIDSEYYGVYGSYGDGAGQFKRPSSIASDSHGLIYISDEQLDRITILDHDGTALGHWGESGDKEGLLNGPSGLAFDHEDQLYISDHLNNRIQKFTPEGHFIRTFGDETDASNHLSFPWHITVAPDNSIYIADWGNHRICRYDSSGAMIQTFGTFGKGDGEFVNPSSVAVDTDGYIYVADWGNERVQVLNSDGAFVAKLRGEATISKWGQDFLDANYEEAEPRSRSNLEPQITRFGGDPHEESAHIEKLFWGPVSVTVDKMDRLYVTESNRHRVQIYERVT